MNTHYLIVQGATLQDVQFQVNQQIESGAWQLQWDGGEIVIYERKGEI